MEPDLFVYADQTSQWIQRLALVNVDGGVTASRESSGWSSEMFLWPLEHDWVWTDVATNPHTGEPASFLLMLTQTQGGNRSESFPNYSLQIASGAAPFLLRPIPSGGVFLFNPRDYLGCGSSTSPLGPVVAQIVGPDGGVSMGDPTGCVDTPQGFMAQVNGCGAAVIYFPASSAHPRELWRVFPDGRVNQVKVALDADATSIVALVNGRFAVAAAGEWLGVIGDEDRWQPVPDWLVPRLGQDLRPLPSGAGYWHVVSQDLDAGAPLSCTTAIEELAADGTSCRTYDVGSASSSGVCTSRPLVRGADGTVAQLSPTCEVQMWPNARP